MEVDNDDFLVCANTGANMDNLAAPLKAWDIKIQRLTTGSPIQTTISGLDNMSGLETEQKAFQHCVLKLTCLTIGGIKICNPKSLKI